MGRVAAGGELEAELAAAYEVAAWAGAATRVAETVVLRAVEQAERAAATAAVMAAVVTAAAVAREEAATAAVRLASAVAMAGRGSYAGRRRRT